MKPVTPPSPNKSALSSRAIETLETWVNLNSHSKNIQGIIQQQKWVEDELRLLGAEIKTLGHHPPVVLGKILATEPSTDPKIKQATITLVCHADTVFPVESPFQKFIRSSDGKTAIGPGVNDDKGSIMVGLLAMESYALQKVRHHTVQLLCMPTEEIGSPGLQALMQQISGESTHTIGLEPSLVDGSIIHSRRGNRWYELKVKGPGGHAGRDAGKISNPVEALNSILNSIRISTEALIKNSVAVASTTSAGGTDDLGGSVTLTSFTTSSTQFNVIPAEAIARLDVRYRSNVLRDQIHQVILPYLEKSEWRLVEDCPAMPYQIEAAALHSYAVQCIHRIESRNNTSAIHCVAGAGSSDSNYLSRPGLIQIDGMGAVGSGLHSEKETVVLDSLFSRSQVILELLNCIR
jgi:glutamate carboxypeptidase